MRNLGVIGVVFACICVNLCLSLQYGDNWAVIVSTSRYWFNYRHVSNALSIYRIVKAMGIPDSRIIFLNTLDIINDARNPLKGEVHNSEVVGIRSNLVDNNVEIDFNGDEVNVDLFLRLLADRLPSYIPNHKRLLATNTSNILIYMSGHGGDEFFKFHDAEELSAQDLGDVLREMHWKQRYKSVLLILETCQAVTMTNYISDIPNIVTLSSSLKGENSYAYGTNKDIGVAFIDRFTHSINEYFQRNYFSAKSNQQYCNSVRNLNLNSLLNSLTPSFLYSTATLVHSKEGTVKERDNILLCEYFCDFNTQQTLCNKTNTLLAIDADGSTDNSVISEERKQYLNSLLNL